MVIVVCIVFRWASHWRDSDGGGFSPASWSVGQLELTGDCRGAAMDGPLVSVRLRRNYRGAHVSYSNNNGGLPKMKPGGKVVYEPERGIAARSSPLHCTGLPIALSTSVVGAHDDALALDSPAKAKLARAD